MSKPFHNVRCRNCHKETDIMDLADADLKYETTPNTLTDLPDLNNVAWRCPHCDFWHTTNNEGDTE